MSNLTTKIGQYKGKAMLEIVDLESKNPFSTFRFGESKARKIVECFEDIKEFLANINLYNQEAEKIQQEERERKAGVIKGQMTELDLEILKTGTAEERKAVLAKY